MKSFYYITQVFLLELIVGTKDALAFTPVLPVVTVTTNSAIGRSTTGSSSTHLDMVARNPNFAKLAGGYLFPEIGRRRSQYVKEHPEMADRIVSLGIGDTTEPIPSHILSGLVDGASKLGTKAGYSGYGDVQGRTDLRTKIAETLYNGIIDPDEVFVSGAFPSVPCIAFILVLVLVCFC